MPGPPPQAPASSAADTATEGVDVTEKALALFEAIDRNIFVRVATDASKHEESLPCHCRYNPDTDPRVQACGESSDCINRLVQMECNPLTCPCGSHCMNRRFQKRQYAKVRVVDAGRKGFGVLAVEDLDAGAFVMEYMGEVVTAAEFRKRTHVYQAEGIRHHYFMSIGNGKVIDATRKGCVARFINHSCGPNCVLQKWMVGGAIRMGIFAERPIRRGEEITFDYKFERLADSEPQLCYCGSPECKGIIGVAKERASRAAGPPGDEDADSNADAADIDEEIEDGTVTRHQRDDIRRRHAAVDDDDDEYASDEGSGGESEPDDGYSRARRRTMKGLTSPEQVLKFVQIMHRSSRQTRIVGILIGKLVETSDRRLLKSLIALQGMGILRAWLQDYDGDDVMLIQILQCIGHMPIATRNTIDESRLEDVVKPLCAYSDENVSSLARDLVERWSALRRVFKIPKKARKESASATPASGAQSPGAPAPRDAASDAAGSREAGAACVGGSDGGSGGSSAPARWRNSPAPQQRMRSESPRGVDVMPRRDSPASWERRPGGQSPAGAARLDRPAGRPPFPAHAPRHYAHTPRSRSPPDYRRATPSRFGRAATAGDHSPHHRQPHRPSDYHHHHHDDDDHSQRPRERFGRWGPQSTFRTSESDRPYSADTSRERTSYAGGYGSNGNSSNGSIHAGGPRHDAAPAAEAAGGAPRLAPGWRMAYSKDRQAYYYHETTKETQWDPPLAEPAAQDAGGRHADGAARRRHDARSYPALVAADRQAGSSGGWPEKGTMGAASPPAAPAATSDGRESGKSRQDELVERALRLNVQTPQGSGKAGAQQLVTPDTDGEPGANGAAAAAADGAAAATEMAARAGGGAVRRNSPDSGLEQPAAKRERLEKRAMAELANFVVRAMSKHKDQVGHEGFKHEARKITKILMEKERKAAAFDPQRLVELGPHKKAKIRQFVADYMEKLATRQAPSGAGREA
ncbi:hypothetical protein LPJ61_001677 [Coemansia biformis]|uniref:[histone H3]-lysine(36) N-trimethyltransferase n=1 Tax=Coemansia biformis TaxID=1286918 RepID=A0A9W7YFI3_9FUNG|nr:hypothetical protein LPJ61_001677 [Coemansia biformis]